ncbi:hypothetical protein [Abyssalbus ytuae]|uniref:Uncharacterized protein n=1 Tax=Abyssalbus ytuae TaxID=2926907 RepID=A0A9E7D0N6_9FLAO|nr:hypothetical protein [Abyssalbus ytuae]UOB18580.1 hypothetical protein MQE35_04650 [Abyssalbus ytuae]
MSGKEENKFYWLLGVFLTIISSLFGWSLYQTADIKERVGKVETLVTSERELNVEFRSDTKKAIEKLTERDSFTSEDFNNKTDYYFHQVQENKKLIIKHDNDLGKIYWRLSQLEKK